MNDDTKKQTKRPTTVVAVATAATLLCGAAAAQEPGRGGATQPGRGDVHSPGWKKVEELKGEPLSPRFPAIGKSIQRVVLENGLVLYLREDRSVPLIRAELIVKAGSYYESGDQMELAGFTAQQMRAGGTERMGAEQLTDRLAFLAAELSARAGDETARVSLDILSNQLEEGLTLFADVILRPAFDPERIELARRNRMFRLRHRNDSPAQILRRELDKLMYTSKHPAGRETRPEHLAAIERDALVAFHKKFYSPDRAYLAVVGDFAPAEMQAKIEQLFGGWKPSGAPLPELPRVETTPRPGIYVIDRELSQSNIVIGHWGIDRSNDDRFAVSLMNTVLGGGSFSSRITERVRSDEGLAYSARSSYATAGREPGYFQASVQTKTETTVRAVQLMLEEINKMQTGKISNNEFGTAKESRLYSYVFRFDDPVDNVVRLMQLEVDGLPADYYESEFRGYQAVTPEQMSQAASKYLRPGELTIFIVGKLDEFREELAKLGELRTIELEEFETPGGGPRGKMRGGRGGGGRPGRPAPGGGATN